MIIVVGWAGQWAAQFACDPGRGLRVTAGQETTQFKLRPGEEVRTPLVVLQPWKGGDWIDAQNAWRRWMIRYNLPRPGVQLPPVRGDDPCERGEPEALRRSVPRGGARARLLVDGCGLVRQRVGLASYRDVGGRQEAIPQRPSRHQRPRSREGSEDHRVV